MSKSVGNVVDPVALVERYGCDQVRYFMLNEVPFGSDGDFSDAKMADCINAKLSNDLGNLAYRTLSFAHKQCGKAVPQPSELNDDDRAMLTSASDLADDLRRLAEDRLLHRMTQATNALVQQANRYIDSQAPWALRKSDPERMCTVLWVLMESLRIVGILHQPFTPTIASQLLDQLGVPSDARSFDALQPGHELVGGTPLPQPAIIVPRYEPPELSESAEESAPAAEAVPAAVSGAQLAELEETIRAQGEKVRVAKQLVKDGSGDKDDVDVAVATLLELKARLPAGHEMLAPPKKKKKQKQS